MFKTLSSKILKLFSIIFCFNSFGNFSDGTWIFHYKNESIKFSQGVLHRGSPMIDLDEVANRFGLKVEVSKSKKEFIIKNKLSKIVKLSTEDTLIKGFWGDSRLSKKPEIEKNKIFVPLDFGDRVLRPLLTGESPGVLFPSRLPFAVDIVIDPGHGGNDFGAIVKEKNSLFLEKDIVLLIAKELKKYLELKNIKVALTRERDVYLALPERTNYANSLQPKLFLSLHLNYSENKKHRGYEIYVLSLKDQENKEALDEIVKENMYIPDELPDNVEKTVAELRARANLEKSLSWSKKLSFELKKSLPGSSKYPVKQGPFYVLYGTLMPSLLLELAYLSHDLDRILIQNSKKRAEFLKPIVELLTNELSNNN